jgi:hypothetical protein
MSAGGGGGAGGLRVSLRTIRAVDFLIPPLPLAFEAAGFEVGAGSASACGEDAATHSARRPTSVIGLPAADAQVGLHLP